MQLDRATPAHLDLHLIVDNYATHKHRSSPAGWRSTSGCPALIPTSSSWLNLVERWFREITDKRIRRGVFTSVVALVEAIAAYIAHHNVHPKPFVWTASADAIVAKVTRSKAMLETLH